MAARTVATTATLEQFRTTFNALSQNDFGDIGTLDAGLSATSVIGAVNEIYGITVAIAGWTISDGSTTQDIGNGETLTVNGTSNEIEVAVSATDTLTIGLPSAVTITTSATINTLSLATGSITDSSGAISFGNENLTTTGSLTSANLVLSQNGTLVFEGATDDAYETTLTVTNPTADRTITLPNATTTLVGINTVDTLTNKTLTQPTITQPSISAPTITSDMILSTAVTLIFEGNVADAYELTLKAADGLTADRTVTLPNETGTVITTGSIDAVTESMMANDAIGSAELKNVVSLIIYNSSGVAQKTIYGAGS